MSKKYLSLLGYGLMMAGGLSSIEGEERSSNKRILNKNPKKKIIPKGMKEFWYGDQVIYSINKKNADKKARKKGLI